MAEEIDIRLAHEFELLGQISHPALAEIAVGDIIILVEARQRALIVARKTQRAIGEDALGVNQMPDNFLDTPLARSIAQFALRLAQSTQESERIVELIAQCSDDVIPLDKCNVFAEMWHIFRWVRSGHFFSLKKAHGVQALALACSFKLRPYQENKLKHELHALFYYQHERSLDF